jgi:hypothetical protein
VPVVRVGKERGMAKKRKYFIQFNTKPKKWRMINGRIKYNRAVWPLLFDSRELAEIYMYVFVDNKLFENSHLSGAYSASIESVVIDRQEATK